MRLARLAAVGLAIGVIAGFASALLRPRPSTPPTGVAATPGDRTSAEPADDHLWDQFRRAEPTAAADLRSDRRVTG